jgi:hypothetical protein
MQPEQVIFIEFWLYIIVLYAAKTGQKMLVLAVYNNAIYSQNFE